MQPRPPNADAGSVPQFGLADVHHYGAARQRLPPTGDVNQVLPHLLGDEGDS